MDDKTAFRQSMETELHALEAGLDRWQAADEHVDTDAQLQREQQQMLDDLHSKRVQARQYLDELQQSGDWSALKLKMETLWSEMRTQISMIESWA